jgi:hypothetical protein
LVVGEGGGWDGGDFKEGGLCGRPVLVYFVYLALRGMCSYSTAGLSLSISEYLASDVVSEAVYDACI